MKGESRFGAYLLDNDIDLHSLAKRTGRSIQHIKRLMYHEGITQPFIAMGYAYALNCDYKELMEKREPKDNRSYIDVDLPFGDK